MSNPFIFQIQSLFRREGNDVLSSPVHCIFAVHEVERQIDILISRLATVTFYDPHIHQRQNNDGPTNYQTYLVGKQYSNELWLGLFVDLDFQVVPVIISFQSIWQVIVNPIIIPTVSCAA